MKFEKDWTGNWENSFRGLRHPLESYAKSDSLFGIENTEWVYETMLPVVETYIETWNKYNDERSDPNRDKIVNFLQDNGLIKWYQDAETYEYAFLGPADIDLAQRMIKAGSPNDKFLRQIFVSVDITAPLYWWKEMDTYKVATVANSTSTMHKLASTPITLDCFEIDDYEPEIPVDMVDQSGVTEAGKKEGFTAHWHMSDFVENWGLIEKLEDLRVMYNKTKDIRYWKELIRWLPESWLQTRTWTANYSTLRNIYHWRKSHKLQEWSSFCDWTKTLPYAEQLITFEN